MDVFTVAVFINLLTSGEVLAALNAIGNAIQNETLGGNASIIWKLSDMERRIFSIFIDTDNEKSEILQGKVENITVPIKFKKRFRDIKKQSSAAYNYLGKETGLIVFNITNLTLDVDGKSFLLHTDKLEDLTETKIYVNSLPKECGAVLKKEYIVKAGEERQVTFGFCGKPQPIVTCSPNGVDYRNSSIAEVSEYNYTYTITLLDNLKPCATKNIVCGVGSYNQSFFQKNIIARGQSPKEKIIASGKCAGYIIGFVIGVIVICVFIYLYVVKWNATTECGKLAGFIVALVCGLALIIALPIAYAGLRDGDPKCPGESTLMKYCDKWFIAWVCIGVAGLIVVIIISCMIKYKVCSVGKERGDQSHGSNQVEMEQ